MEERNIDWDAVKNYMKQYVGTFCTIAETQDIVWIGTDLPDEYANKTCQQWENVPV